MIKSLLLSYGGRFLRIIYEYLRIIPYQKGKIMAKINTVNLDLTFELINKLSSIDRFSGEWLNIEKRSDSTISSVFHSPKWN
jgi:hypothetical protein